MATVTLSAYKFSLTHDCRERNTTQYYPVNNVSGKSFLQIITEFCETYEGYESDRLEKRVFKSDILDDFQEYDNGDSRLNFSAVMGKINSGEWGYTREIVDPTSGDVVYSKPEGFADVLPFLFCVAIPYEDNQESSAVSGIIMFQNLGVYGIKTAFFKHLRCFFVAKYPEIQLEVNPLCPSAFARHIMETGIIKEVSVIKNTITADLANGLGLSSTQGYQEWSFKRIDGLTQGKKQALSDYILSGNGSIHEILQLPDITFDNIKYKLQVGKKTITLNLKNLDSLNVSEEVSNEAIGTDGHPIPDRLKTYFSQMYKDYAPYVNLYLRND